MKGISKRTARSRKLDPLAGIREEIRSLSARPECLAELAALLSELALPFLSFPTYREFFSHWEEKGFHLTPNHFYQPIPDTRFLPEALWSKESELVGLEMNEEEQLHLLRDVFPRYQSEYDQFPHSKTAKPGEFYFDNNLFGGTDALVYYCMVRHLKPSTIIEVGAGMSTRVASRALSANGNGEIVCIEPYPDEALRSGLMAVSELIEEQVQSISPEHFEGLKAGDILFIDSSHVVRIGGDVNYLFLEILPRLREGVYVHIHDIFLPSEYPREWVREELRFWSEQYLLHAFLLFNSAYRVVFANTYLAQRFMSDFQRTFPRSPWWGGGSFWLQRGG